MSASACAFSWAISFAVESTPRLSMCGLFERTAHRVNAAPPPLRARRRSTPERRRREPRLAREADLRGKPVGFVDLRRAPRESRPCRPRRPGSSRYRTSTTPEIEWMLPSNIRPTISPFALISGLPELPPTMSLLVERLNGVFMSSASFARSASVSGTRNGSAPVARSNARDSRVNGSTGCAVLVPALHRAVVQPQRERRVRIHARAEHREARLGDRFAGDARGSRRPRPRSACAARAHRHRRRARARSSDPCDAATAAAAAVPQRAAARPDRASFELAHERGRERVAAIPSQAACAPSDDPGRATRACARGRCRGASSSSSG